MLGNKLTQAAAGAGGADPLYVDDVFSTYLYEGTGSAQTITNGIDLAGEGGAVWFKVRNFADNHTLQDSERKTGTYHDDLCPNENQAETTNRPWGISSMNSDGFTIGGSNAQINSSSYNYASWTFRKARGFFDVVTYTGDGNTSQQIAHSLGSVPGMVVVKNSSSSGHWVVNHVSTGAGTGRLFLNQTNANSTGSATAYWNSTAPTSTHFTVGADSNVNASGNTFVAYIFAHDDQSFGANGDEAVIKCGSYTGDGTTSLSVNVGFEPQFLIIKRTDSTEDWHIFDNMRGVASDGNDNPLKSNNNYTESSSSGEYISFTPTGFQVNSTGSPVGGNNGNYIYIAIRRPHKLPETGTDVFAIDRYSGSTTLPFEAPFAPDLAFIKHETSSSSWFWIDRLRGNNSLKSNNNTADSSHSSYNVQFRGAFSQSWTDYIGYMFRRATGFFDMVNYIGNSPNSSSSDYQTITHNLGATPELIFVKNRENNWHWSVYSQSLGNSKRLILNLDDAQQTDGSAYWTSTSPTSTNFTVGYDPYVNKGDDHHIAYLFASLDGISKIGTYTGTGNDIDIDCGFTNGARFVMVKRTDSANSWFVMDTTRGIGNGDDPYILLNDTGGGVNNNSIIDPYSSGFQITGDAPSGLNASGGTYLFLAIA